MFDVTFTTAMTTSAMFTLIRWFCAKLCWSC